MSIRKVFVTGGSGFVGRTLLRELSRIDGLQIVALDRSGTLPLLTGAPSLEVVRGDVLDPASYARPLGECDAVIHLAAATGKASAEAHVRDTAVGTERLLEACRVAGIERFLFVSSIAAAFLDTRGYPYAEAKLRAERATAASGLRYCIIRPTMIFGRGAPVLASLTKLAMLPMVVVPGSGKVRVQPVSVDDVVRSILLILQTDRFHSETFEIGGPEILGIDELLQRIRAAGRGARGRTLRFPLGLLQAPLALAERMGLRSVLPATAGQLSSFRQNGVVAPNPVQQEIAHGLTTLSQMIGDGTAITARADAIEHECIVFTRHLLGVHPEPAVVTAYRHALRSMPALHPAGAWERALLGMARSAVAGARCADAFAALFARRSVMRKRLVVLLAILEVRAPSSDHIDLALGGGAASAIARVAWRGLGSMICMVIGAVWIVPVWIAFAARGEPAR